MWNSSSSFLLKIPITPHENLECLVPLSSLAYSRLLKITVLLVTASWLAYLTLNSSLDHPSFPLPVLLCPTAIYINTLKIALCWHCHQTFPRFLLPTMGVQTAQQATQLLYTPTTSNYSSWTYLIVHHLPEPSMACPLSFPTTILPDL